MKIEPAILPLLEGTLTIMAQIFLSQKISKPNLAGNKNASFAQIQSVLNTRVELKVNFSLSMPSKHTGTNWR